MKKGGRKMNRVNLITLGVKDLQLSLLFYRDGLGFQTSVRRKIQALYFLIMRGQNLRCIL